MKTYKLPLFAILAINILSQTVWAQTFQYSRDVPSDQRQLLESDIRLLEKIEFRDVEAELYRVSDIDSPLRRGQELLDWMKERVRYVVGEKFIAYDNRYTERMNYSFDLPGILPDLGGSSRQSGPYKALQPQIVMQNLGPTTYYLGKKSGHLLGLKISGIGKVPISSPRVGVIQVGPGLFKVPKDKQATDYDVRMERVFTLLHEARHSDGRGEHLGMMHEKCPSYHTYSGYYACDFNLNGAYTVAAFMGKALTENCTECSIGHREKMRLSYLDSFNRVLKEKRKTSLAVEMEQRRVCEELKDYNLDLPYCEEIKRRDELQEEIPKAIHWDSQPEGRIEKPKKSFWDIFF